MISTFIITDTAPASVELEKLKSTVGQHFIAAAGTTTKFALIKTCFISITLD